MPSKVDVYSVVRNEIKIIHYFLRHYETFADRIFVWEDGSDDGTREVLEAHPKVTILPISLGKVDDNYFVEKMWPQYREISRGYADWAICVDVDEFVYSPNILEKLALLTKEGVGMVLCKGFTMYHEIFPTTEGQIYDEVKNGIIDAWSTKPILFNPSIDVVWARGRHSIGVMYPRMKKRDNTDILILHFRYLGWDYYFERTKRNFSYSGVEFTDKSLASMPDRKWVNPKDWWRNATRRGRIIKVID